MTLVVGEAEPVQEPHTHVFIVGVGYYPNIQKSRAARDAATLLAVTPLTSPPPSARALADWFLTSFHNPASELGSLELLLSDKEQATYLHPETRKLYDIESADFENLKLAFQRWENRCNSNQKNVAVFYFCGHGAEGANRILIPADFPVLVPASGQPDWNQVVNFSGTLTNMGYCKAAYQFFFLDSCRMSLPPMVAALGSPLISPRILQTQVVEAQMLYTIPEREATGGFSGRISAYADLLLHALRGSAAAKTQHIWHVTGMGVLTACERIREVFAEEGLTGTQYPVIELVLGTPVRRDPVLHQYKEPPLIPIRINCKPESASHSANYTAVDGTSEIELERHERLGYGHGFLNPGQYPFDVKFAGGRWARKLQLGAVEPPVCVVEPPVCCLCFEADNV